MDTAYIEKNWRNNINKNLSASIAAWDSVAEDYVYDDSVSFQNDDFLKIINEKIPLNKDMNVLDIGCGAGAYSVAISEKVGKVVGLDFSAKMLEIGRKYISENNISNIEFIEEDWWNCDSSSYKAKFDFVFAHTTPAIIDYNSLVKMIKASKRYCALCKPARRTDMVEEEIRRIAGIVDKKTDDSVAYTFDTIWNMGYNPEVLYHDTVWESFKPLEEAKEWYINRIKGASNISESTENKIYDYLKKISNNNLIHEKTCTTLVTMVWEIN